MEARRRTDAGAWRHSRRLHVNPFARPGVKGVTTDPDIL
jgi:hypothetical protein